MTRIEEYPKRFQIYVDYLNNTGIISAADFDEDWSPIGHMVRQEMEDAGLIHEITDETVAANIAHSERTGRAYFIPEKRGIILHPDLIKRPRK